MLSQFTASIICRREGEYICMSRVWVDPRELSPWQNKGKTVSCLILIKIRVLHFPWENDWGKMIAQTTAYKKVVCLCGLFQSAAVILAIAAQHGGGGLGGVLVSIVCCGAFVRYLFIFKMYCHLLNTLQVVWAMNMYFAPSLFVLFLFINTKQTLNMDSLLIGINVERTLRLHTVTKRKTQIFTSAQKTSGFPLNLGILRAVT